MSSFAKALIQSIWYPREVAAMVKFKLSLPASDSDISIAEANGLDISDSKFAYICLSKVSRSFAVVIQLLDEQVRDAICLFYLILRGLDSVEDDMEYPLNNRTALLRTFYSVLQQPDWKIKGVGDTEDYKQLLESFDRIIRFFQTLNPKYQDVIIDITKKMGNGMADFAEKYSQAELMGVDSIKEYELYCHYVAGLVGLGLDRIFVSSGLEDYDLEQSQPLANSMGLFLQKVNITRDYLEDFDQKRSWWPKEIWGIYSQDLGYFKANPHSIRSRLCLNHMVYNGLEGVVDVITYLSKIQNPSIFNFCAIPQVMAISTLALLYNNTAALTHTIKIRRGVVCDVAINCTDISLVKGYFYQYLDQIDRQLINPQLDHSLKQATNEDMQLAQDLYRQYQTIIQQGKAACQGYKILPSGWGSVAYTTLSAAALIGAGAFVYYNINPQLEFLNNNNNNNDNNIPQLIENNQQESIGNVSLPIQQQ